MSNTPEDRAVRTGDKLTYRIIIQNRVNDALGALGTDRLEKCVVSLRVGMQFNMVGLPFKTKIDENLRKLKFDEAVKIRLVQRLHPGHWEHAGKRIQYEFTFDEEFYTDELMFLINLLASHNALMEPKDFIEKGDQV